MRATRDFLISNAGIAPISLLDDLRVEDWEDMIDVNIKGVLYDGSARLWRLADPILPILRAHAGGIGEMFRVDGRLVRPMI